MGHTLDTHWTHFKFQCVSLESIDFIDIYIYKTHIHTLFRGDKRPPCDLSL